MLQLKSFLDSKAFMQRRRGILIGRTFENLGGFVWFFVFILSLGCVEEMINERREPEGRTENQKKRK